MIGFVCIFGITGEAAHLAADFDYVCESEFPASQLAEQQYRQHSDPTQQQSRKNAIIAAKYVVLYYSKCNRGNECPQRSFVYLLLI